LQAQSVDFCGNKSANENENQTAAPTAPKSEFVEISPDDNDLPF
jgi:hypothetical protein